MTAAANTPTPSQADTIRAARQQALEDVFGSKFTSRFQSPVVFIDSAELQSPTSIRFFKKDFAYLSKQLHMEYQYRSWKGFNQEMLERYNEIITKKLENINVLMTNWANRLQKLLDQNSDKMEGSLYPNTLVVTVPVIATHARSYFKLLTDLDRVSLLAGTANLLGIIDSKQRAESELICKKAVRAFRSVLQTEVIKLYREADRLVKEQHGRGEIDSGIADAVAEQGKAIAEFDASQEPDTDHGMDLGGADPAQLIDDAAAASSAVASASRSRAAKSSKPAKAEAEAETSATATSSS